MKLPFGSPRARRRGGGRRRTRHRRSTRGLLLESLETRNLLVASVGDFVWLDANGDGVQQGTEGGVEGAVVELLDSAGNSQGFQITGTNGQYSFGNLTAGDYRLAVRTPVGLTYSVQDVGGDDNFDSDVDVVSGQTSLFTLTADQADPSRDAGLAGQLPGFGFALNAGGVLGDRAESIAVDAQGNVYVTGSFTGSAEFDFGPSQWILNSNGGKDIFVARYTSTGALVWAIGLGGSGDDEGLGIALGSSGDLLLTGRFEDTVDFDPSAATVSLTSQGESDLFVARLSPVGSLQWAEGFGGSQADSGFGISSDPANNVLITGEFRGEVDFDPGPGETTLDGSSGSGLALKLTPSGELAWVRSSTGLATGKTIASDGASNVFWGGTFEGSTTFGTSPLTSQGQTDIFTVKLDGNGNYQWVAGFGGSESDRIFGLEPTSAGPIYLSGEFAGTVDFDPGVGIASNSATGVSSDAFLSKLQTDGSFGWARTWGGIGLDRATGVAVDGTGNILTTGRFEGTVDFNPGGATLNLDSAGGGDVFVSKFDPNGNLIHAIAVGGPAEDEPLGIGVDGDGHAYLAGGFVTSGSQVADFDPGPDVFGLSSNGASDAFVARLDVFGSGLNVAPELEPGLLLVVTNEDTTVDLALAEVINDGPGTAVVTDANSSDALGGIAVVQTQGNGEFFYSVDGTGYKPIGGVSDAAALLLPPGAFLRYVPDGLNAEIATLTYRAWDGTVGNPEEKVSTAVHGGNTAFSEDTDTITYRVTGVNDAPELTPHGPTAETDEDTAIDVDVSQLVNAGPGSSDVTDVDTNDPLGGIAIVNMEALGTLEYSLDGGSTYIDAGEISNISSLLLPPSAKLRYVPNGMTGEIATITYRAWDQSEGQPGDKVSTSVTGNTTAFSAATDAITITVSDLNDAPVLVAEAPLVSTDEDTGITAPLPLFINTQGRSTKISDVDPLDFVGGIVVIATSGSGNWLYSTNSVDFLPVESVSEGAALHLPHGADLRYEPDGANGGTATATYRGWDQTAGNPGDRLDVSQNGGTTPYSEDTDVLTVNVGDLNDAPTGVDLSNDSVPENMPGATVGTLTVRDPDSGDAHQLSVSDTRFEIVGDILRLKAGESLDHEAEPQVTLTVTAVDSGSPPLSVNQTLTIDVVDRNERPTAVSLSNQTVAENATGAAIGDLSVTDPDDGDSHTFAVSDNRFQVTGAQLELKPGVSLNHETEPQVTLTVTATDSGSLSHDEQFVIQVQDVNEAPSGISLSNDTVNENDVAAVVGNLLVDDPDAGDSHTFVVGDIRFEAPGGVLKLRAGQSLNFEAEPQVTTDVTVTDAAGLQFTESLVIRVIDRNEAPSSISLDNNQVDENEAGAAVGNVIVSDPDQGDSHTFTVSDSRFEIDGTQLKLKAGVQLDHETESTVTLTITAHDSGVPAEQVSGQFTIEVQDVNEAPVLVHPISDQGATSNILFEFTVPEDSFEDPDQGDTLTYSVAMADGGPLPSWLGFNAASRLLSGKPGIYDPGDYDLRVTATDSGGLSADDTFTLFVQAASSPWQNPANGADVNDDGIISAVDVLIIVNRINGNPGNSGLPEPPQAPPPYLDANGDNMITAADVLLIINILNGGGGGAESGGEGEGPAAPPQSATSAPLPLDDREADSESLVEEDADTDAVELLANDRQRLDPLLLVDQPFTDYSEGDDDDEDTDDHWESVLEQLAGEPRARRV